MESAPRRPRIGPAATALIGLVAIAIGAAVKSGFIEIRRGGSAADSTLTVRTGGGEVEMPVAPGDSGWRLEARVAPATPPELAADTITSPRVAGDSNAVRPTPSELADLADELIVPVAGVQPKDLLDTFDEPRGTRRHNALDIPAPRGTAVLSATDGKVYASDPSNRFVLMYGHLDRYADGLTDGMPLKRGETIGYVGTTGNAPPNVPHLHFAIARTGNVARWWTGMPVDPRPLLRR
jgi:murein DD-endopeptidase MepM/ murein hydrolase activator NlpD